MGEEVLDELDVVGRHADQVPRAPPRQVRGREGVERPEEPEAHVGEEPVGDVVGQPRLEPVEESGERRDDEQGGEPAADRAAPLDGQHGEGAHHAHADQRGDASHAEQERDDEPPAIAAAQPQEHRQHPGPPKPPRRGQDGLRRLRLRARPVRRRAGAGGRARREGAVLVDPLRDLGRHEPRVRAAAHDQLRMRAALDDAPAVEHEDAIGADHARQPVREDQGRAAGHEPVERRLDRRPRSPRPPTRAPRRGSGSARRAGAPARWRCAGAGRPRAGRRARPPPSGSPAAGAR